MFHAKSTRPAAFFAALLTGCAASTADETRPYNSEPTHEDVPSTVSWNGPTPDSPQDPPPSQDAAPPPQQDAAPPPQQDAAPPPQQDAAPPPQQDAAANPCVYPSGPFGTSIGSVVPSYFEWTGFRPGSSTSENISPEEFFDCDGKRGIHAIYVDYVAEWCSACNMAASDLAYRAAQWESDGVVVVTFIIQTSSYSPATVATASAWREQYDLHGTYVFADPSEQLFSGDYLPYEVLIDPRTMKIVATDEVSESTIFGLAQQNQ